MVFVPVWKASRRPPKGGDDSQWRSTHAAADSAQPAVAVTFIDGVNRVASEVTPELVAKLVEIGALDRIVDHSIDWQFMELLLQKGIKPDIIAAIKASADSASLQTAETIKAALGVTPDLTFNATSPRLIRWINNNTAEMVRGVTAESREAIKTVIGRSINDDLSPQEAFGAIRRTIGLTQQMATAAQNIYDNGINEGLDHDEAALEADTYAQRALGIRANNIARTETMAAANQGQNEGWDQAADQGYFNPNDAEVEWVTTPDDRLCPTCAAMDGVRRPFDGMWHVTIYDAKGRARGAVDIDNPSMVHPLCRCTHKLILGGE